MAWNEPGGNKPRDPWGNRGGDQGPPDLDEVLDNLRKKFAGLFGGGSGGGGSSANKPPAFMYVIIAAVLGVLYLFWGAYTVEQQERSVVLSFGKYDRTSGPGLRWHWPPVEQMFKVNVGQTRSYRLSEEMLTEDTNIVAVSLEVQYQVVDPQSYLLRVAEPEAVLHHSTESALRQIVGASSMDDVLINNRREIAIQVGALLQEYLDKFNTGIDVVDFVLTDTKAPEAVREAFNDVAKAKEDEERFKKQAEAYANSVVPESRGRAQRLREEALAYKEQLVARAEGDADRFRDLLAEYRRAPAVTRERLYIETMESVLGATSKVLVDVEGGNNMMYLPLDQIIKQHQARRDAEGTGPASGVPEAQPATPERSAYGSRTRELRQ